MYNFIYKLSLMEGKYFFKKKIDIEYWGEFRWKQIQETHTYDNKMIMKTLFAKEHMTIKCSKFISFTLNLMGLIYMKCIIFFTNTFFIYFLNGRWCIFLSILVISLSYLVSSAFSV